MKQNNLLQISHEKLVDVCRYTAEIAWTVNVFGKQNGVKNKN